jgi:hypothetical protein
VQAAAMQVRPQDFRKLGISPNVQQENKQHQRKKRACKFQGKPRSTPSPAFVIVENGLAFRHIHIPS